MKYVSIYLLIRDMFTCSINNIDSDFIVSILINIKSAEKQYYDHSHKHINVDNIFNKSNFNSYWHIS